MSHLIARERLRAADTIRQHLPSLGIGLRSGVTSVATGMLVLFVPCVLLWVASPRGDEELGDALRVASCLWVAAHGAPMVRQAAVDGTLTPVGLTPLFLMALPCRLLYRNAVRAITGPPDAPHPAPATAGPHDRVGRFAGILLGYLAATLPFAFLATSGTPRIGLLPGLTAVLLFALLVAGCGTWVACGGITGLLHTSDELWQPRVWERWLAGRGVDGRQPPVGAVGDSARNPGWQPFGLLPFRWAVRSTAWLRTRCPGGDLAALRAAGVGCAALLAGGGLLTVSALLAHAPEPGARIAGLAQDLPGALALLLISVALVPNAVVWATAYALGPGFLVGVGRHVGPVGATPGTLPDLPLLDAVPRGGSTPLLCAAISVPVLAGLAVALLIGRYTAGERLPARRGTPEHQVAASTRSVRRRVGRRGAAFQRMSWRSWARAPHPLRGIRQALRGSDGDWPMPPEVSRGDGRCTVLGTVLLVLLAAFACAALVTVLTGLAGGPVGNRELAAFGPSAWQVGCAVLAWVTALALPGALLVRAVLTRWRARP